MPCDKKKRIERLQLWIEVGTLALLAGCGAFYFRQNVFIYPAWRFWHYRTTIIERPAPKCDLPIPDHPAVDSWVKWFSEKYHGSFQTQLDRAHFYAVPAREIFMRKGLPKDLICVALIESGFSPAATSHANAAGLWQIVPETASRFGLEQNKWVDERRHPTKAAKAAADYLSLLYNRFGSWSLALAAYNAGENAVQGALDKSGLNTFWDLMENGYLPAETQDYVPKVFAAVKILRNPDLYGFRLNSEYFAALRETVSVPGGLKLSWVGKQIGVSEDLLKSSNPELSRSITPPGGSRYELRLPLGTGDQLMTALARDPEHGEKPPAKSSAAPQSHAFTPYRVKTGDTWSGIAAKHKCSATSLAALNGMKPSQTLKAGLDLKLPSGAPSSLSKVQTQRGKESASSSGSRSKSLSRAQQKYVRYLVRRGDTLSSVAGKFHIPVKTLCTQNKMNPTQKLAPGNILTICTSRPDSYQSAKKKVD